MVDWRETIATGQRCPHYCDFLKQRRVVVVGPAETLIGSNAGPDMDSFDVVVRLNNAYTRLPFPPHLAADIGGTCSLLYLCPAELMHLSPDDVRMFESVGVRFVASWSYRKAQDFTDGRYDPSDPEEDFCLTTVSQQSHELFADSSVRVVILDSAFFEAVWNLIGANPKCGFLAILDLLRHPIAELHVTGMTFMHGGGHLFRRYKIITPELNHKGEATTSDPSSELAIFRSIYSSRAYGLTVDHALHTILLGRADECTG